MTRRSPNSRPHSHAVESAPGAIRSSVILGIVIGILQGATPLAFWWLDDATVYALGLAVIAAIYIGFAVADGRPNSSPSRPASPPVSSSSPPLQ